MKPLEMLTKFQLFAVTEPHLDPMEFPFILFIYFARSLPR